MSLPSSGTLQLQALPVNMREVVSTALAAVASAADAKGIILENWISNRGEATTTGDHRRLYQVICCLLSNAIKYTDKGGTIQVIFRTTPLHAEVEVRDSGIGIEATLLAHLFDPRQGLAGRVGRLAGLGEDGLAIARQVVALHGGSLQAESDGKGKGAAFTVRLPLSNFASLPPEPVHSNPTPAPLHGVTILFVDDDLDTRALLVKILRRAGASVTEAASAREALGLLETIRVAVLISDIGMPDLDGYELIKQAKIIGRKKGWELPAIALTAFGLSEDRQRALTAGFQEHLPKPVDFEKLIGMVAKMAGVEK